MIFSTGNILSDDQLKRLKQHKYKSEGRSFLEELFQPFWNGVTELFPRWLAPNLITTIGLAANIFTTLILIYYSPDGAQVVPAWAFYLSAASLFFYQTLDACDGKQARRTNTSSPLGELFDHGCDSISTIFVGVSACISVRMGTCPWAMFWQVFTAATLFYVAHWQTYVSGLLRFGKFDVTEVQLAVMLVQILSGLFGVTMWDNLLFGIQLKFYPFMLEIIASLVTLYYNFSVIFTGGCGKNGSSVAGTSVLSPSIPYALVIIPAFVLYQKSPTRLFQRHPCLYVITFGMVAAKVTNRLIVSHMSRSEMDYMDSVLWGPGLLFLNQYFNNLIDETILLWVVLIYVVCDFLRYAGLVCNQICDYLGIRVFVITPPHPYPTRSARNSR